MSPQVHGVLTWDIYLPNINFVPIIMEFLMHRKANK